MGYVLSAALEFILFIADLHDLAGCGLEVLLQLLELSTLLKESFGGSTALVLKDLLAFQVSTLGSLHEFVSIVLVSDLQVVECVGKSFDLLLTLADFAVKLVTVALELLLFLSSFDYKVSLCVFTVSLNISTRALVALHETLVLDAKILNLLSAHLELNSDLVALFLGSLLFRLEDVLVDLNFLLTLIHRHLELVLAVL